MRMYKIEIDQDVMEYLKGKAEPFTDTPNDVLRRLIFRNGPNKYSVNAAASEVIGTSPPQVPPGTPKALEHILQVAYFTHYLNTPRSKATKLVAEMHGGIAPQTVLDKYCRQLNLTASEFDKLVSEPGLKKLKEILYVKFHNYSNVIDNYLQKQQ